MRCVGLKVLKNRLSEYVKIAAAGETVLVTDRDRVVAELTAPASTRGAWVSDALLADAVRQGWVVPPAMPQAGAPPRVPVCSWADLQSDLDAAREDR